MRTITLIFIIFFAQIASAQVFINEVQISPISERFIELYNSDDSDVDLTGWYIQRKTATGSSFSSLVTSTQLNGKIIRSHSYFLISRGQVGNSDVVVDNLTLTESNTIRMRDSKGSDVDQIEWGSIDEGESYQRASTGGWVISTPTPGAPSPSAPDTSLSTQDTKGASSKSEAVSTTSSNNSSFPVEPQIFAKITAQTRTVSVGAAATFTGRVWGLKKELIENARMVWATGDGATLEGVSVSHTYYYPGEYIVVLDASSGYYSASDRVRIVAVTPLLALRTGGDEAHSFIAIENRGADELDLSGWQVAVQGKIFTIPKNTLVGARKTLMLASEVTALATPTGSIASLHFPNGSRVSLQGEAKVAVVNKESMVTAGGVTGGRASRAPLPVQTANTLAALDRTSDPYTPAPQESSLLIWYIGVAFLAAFALLGLRFARTTVAPDSFTADDFEIIDESKNEKNDLF